MDHKEKNKNTKKNRPRHQHNDNHIHRHSIIDSQGPDRKMKGTASQLFDRYMALGKDAAKERNLQEAENFFQHAEHYRMIMSTFKDTTHHEKKELPKEAEKESTAAPTMILPPKKTGAVDDKA